MAGAEEAARPAWTEIRRSHFETRQRGTAEMGADALEHEKLRTQTAMLVGRVAGLCRLLRRRIAQHRLVLAERGQHLCGAVHDVDRPTTPLDLREGATLELADVELDGTAQRLSSRTRVE